jgi:type IV secretory pathway TrbD component
VSDPGDLHPQTPDVGALKRRVLLTAVLSLLAWFGVLYVLDAFGLGAWYAAAAAVVLYVALVRPLMQPVRDAVRLRRRLAYQAWLDERQRAEEDGRGQV